MTRYVRRPPVRSVYVGYECDEPAVIAPTITVLADEHETWTGLYDADGAQLHRVREPIGFAIPNSEDAA